MVIWLFANIYTEKFVTNADSMLHKTIGAIAKLLPVNQIKTLNISPNGMDFIWKRMAESAGSDNLLHGSDP